MDFYQIVTKETKSGVTEVYPEFRIGRSRDLMVRGRAFYAIWDEEAGLWSTDEYDVQRLVDKELYAFAEGTGYVVKDMRSFNNNGWVQFRRFLSHVSDNSHQLDENLTFANTPVKKSDYVSRRLPYSVAPGDYSAWDELIGTLYSKEERAKIEWAIGSIVAGDSKKIQKFLVLYGPAGSGKSTVLNIFEWLFAGYTTTFEAKALAGNNNNFATENFKHNPLVAIQHDGDLSKIEDNTKLNSIISHEFMTMNEKYKPSYTARVNAMLIMGTNQPVRISDAKSGIIRRLIDVTPTGAKLPFNHYQTLMSKIEFELGAIAQHCLDVYRKMGKSYYNNYKPLEMMFQTDIFFNFVEAHYDIFKAQDFVTLKQAYALYKTFCADTGIDKPVPQYRLREELRNYFSEFKDRSYIEGHEVRSVYSGFSANKFRSESKSDKAMTLVIDDTESLLDRDFEDQPAQYAREDGTPSKRWVNVKTTLAELDTARQHYVNVPVNHIVIDFDLKDDDGQKSLEKNLEAASRWPATYAELSRSGEGVHLHYNYTGDAEELRRIYSDGIEVKVFTGDAALRRQLSRCNSVPVAEISSGLPLKEKKMLPAQTIQSEKGLRDLIARNLRKEIHPGTKPSIDFIHKILSEAYETGLAYDVTDLRPTIIAFANNSTNQPLQALRVVQKMQFASDTEVINRQPHDVEEDTLVLFDVEVFPNLFVVCWKYRGSDTCTRMINPTGQEVESLFRLKLVGFNCRRYDNHILYARYMGYNNEQLFNLSQKIIDGNIGAMFGEAYNLSYADVWDFCSEKKGLKKWQIDLGIPHKELDFPWDQPVPEEHWDRVGEYCENDVRATESVMEARIQDFVARQILAELSGLTVNDTTQKHTARIIFGADRNPQKSFVYTDLSKEFPGYTFDRGVSTYKGEITGEGGYVYAEPGIYSNVALLDVASMHPTSIEQLNLFGPYTSRFSELKEARLAIKHKEFKTAKGLLGGKLAQFIDADSDSADALSYALKIVVNTVYGLTSAKFDNAFRDIRNVDNIVAKRGALFMIDLKLAVQEQGFTVAHIKTDSIKIPDATPEIIAFVTEFGRRYGYTFEHEATYDKFCLVNDAVYVAQKTGSWIAVGAQFQHPYVYKSLFTGEPIVFDDYCETKAVQKGAIYIDFEYDRPMVLVEGMHFVGRIGRFVPVTKDGGMLYRVNDGKPYAVSGTKGYTWMEAEIAQSKGSELEIDLSYFEHLVDSAIKAIAKFGSFEEFIK